VLTTPTLMTGRRRRSISRARWCLDRSLAWRGAIRFSASLVVPRFAACGRRCATARDRRTADRNAERDRRRPIGYRLQRSIRVGTVIEAKPFPEARKPAFQLRIDFGPEIGVKKSSAQITRHYTPELLVGRQVAAVVNFPPRQIGPMMSEVLTLGFPDETGEVVLIGPGHKVPNGGRMF
jgi:tRNA-binding protein